MDTSIPGEGNGLWVTLHHSLTVHRIHSQCELKETGQKTIWDRAVCCVVLQTLIWVRRALVRVSGRSRFCMPCFPRCLCTQLTHEYLSQQTRVISKGNPTFPISGILHIQFSSGWSHNCSFNGHTGPLKTHLKVGARKIALFLFRLIHAAIERKDKPKKAKLTQEGLIVSGIWK